MALFRRGRNTLLLGAISAVAGCALTSIERTTNLSRVSLAPMPIVIAHRGASGYRPEHTLAAYATAALQGADYIELDLVSTSDGQLIARHDNLLNLSTDVANRVEFTDREMEKIVDGRPLRGWFSEDFTLEEIRQLRAVERVPDIRPQNALHDGAYSVPLLSEVIAVIQSLEAMLGRDIGLYIELKHPAHFEAAGLAMEQTLVNELTRHGYTSASDAVFLQSFEIRSLRRLNAITDLRLVQLLGSSGSPYDVQGTSAQQTFAAMATATGLREIASYADGVGPDKDLLIPRDAAERLSISAATDFVADAHAAGLVVHPYTFRAENAFLPANLRSSRSEVEYGDATEELSTFLELGIDGFFTDHTDIGLSAREEFSTSE
ncbi:MAG: glycerophosphodiester phosphodiesterase [Gammaproteobacteria bacterium]